MEHANRIQELLNNKKKIFADLNDEVWEYAEPRFADTKTSKKCRKWTFLSYFLHKITQNHTEPGGQISI